MITTLTSDISVTEEININLTPEQKELFNWHSKLGFI